MLKLRKTRRALALTAGAVALAAGATIATSGTAFASGNNWAAWAGPVNQGCYGYTLWNTNQVTGYVVSHGDWCQVSIHQWDSSTGGTSSWTSNWTLGALNTPTWWHGAASDGGTLWDWVCVTDGTTGNSACSRDGGQYYN